MSVSTLFREVGSFPSLASIASENQKLHSIILFIPGSIVAILAAMYARAAISGCYCYVKPSSCATINGIPVRPIGLGSASTFKSTSKGGGAPWIAATGYSESSGWSSLKQLEILASGGLPYFVDL